MRNELFQQAKKFTSEVRKAKEITDEDIQKAKNAISSAFANSTIAEQKLLQQYQEELEKLDLLK